MCFVKLQRHHINVTCFAIIIGDGFLMIFKEFRYVIQVLCLCVSIHYHILLEFFKALVDSTLDLVSEAVHVKLPAKILQILDFFFLLLSLCLYP
jgi:cytochrome b subunit of formate dehydrogenase